MQDRRRLGQCHVQPGPAHRSLRRPDREDARAAARRRVLRGAGQRNRLRASYGRTLETPYNENLVLSARRRPGYSAIGRRCRRASANQVEVGAQQALGHWFVADVGYFTSGRPTPTTSACCSTRRSSSRSRGITRSRRLHRPHQPGRAPRVQRLRGDGAHQRDLLSAWPGGEKIALVCAMTTNALNPWCSTRLIRPVKPSSFE